MPFSTQPVPEDLLRDPQARIQNLSEIGASVEIDDNIPPRRYFRSGMEMMRMANVYYEEKNLENAFILYSKFITLFLEKLPHHQDYQSVPANDKKSMKKKIRETFPKAEKIKEILKERYNQESLIWQQQKKKEMARQEQEREQRNREREEQIRMEREHHKYEKEKQERLNQERDKRHAGIGVSGAFLDDEDFPNDDGLSRTEWPTLLDFESTSAGTISQVINPAPMTGATDLRLLPELPASKPTIDRTTKPSSLLSHSGMGSMSSSELRKVVVPLALMSRFLKLAQLNTEKAIETCGVLAGRLAHNVFTVTHLLLPHQHGTSDSCTTENEEEIFEFQDQHDLLTLGWIHTHPTQTSFMSSVDLHTHCAYQLMMPEAIAIVCAPKFNETGIFTLTPDFGLDFIAKCQQSGFHPHPKDPPLYETCTHVITDGASHISVVDLRKT